MMARIRKSKGEDQGFTLIELLVVMIIIGILAAIAVPVFMNQRQKAVDTSIKSDLKSVASNIEAVAVDTQSYPAAITASGGAATGNTITVNSQAIALSSGNVVTYTVNGTNTGFCLSGYNTKANANAAGKAYWYSSAGGGFQAGEPGGKPGTCP